MLGIFGLLRLGELSNQEYEGRDQRPAILFFFWRNISGACG